MQNVNKKYILYLLIFTVLPVFGVQPDLILQKEITTKYMAYLDSMETVYLNLLPGNDDTQTMKAHMGLAIIQAARTYVNGDTLVNDLDQLMTEMNDNIENIVLKTVDDIFPLFDAGNPNEFVLNLTDFFETGTYPAYRDSISEWLSQNSELGEDMADAIEHFGEKTKPLMDAFGEHWGNVYDGTADFEFIVRVVGSQYEDTPFIFSRKFFNRQKMIKELGEAMATILDSGFTQILDSLNNNSPDIDPGVAVVQQGLDSLSALVDSLQIILWNQPFAPFDFNLAWMDSLQKGIAEIDTLLGGKTYPIGPEAENKVIRPRGIIESLAHHDGLWGVYQDYYRGGESASYTFYNTFPNGLTSKMYAMIKSDIILNANDSEEAFTAKVHTYQASLKAKQLLKPLSPDEHFGLALTLTYDLLNDEEYFGNVDEAIQFISEGKINDLLDTFDWSDFDLHDQIAEIRSHVDQYIESENPTNYVVLIKTNNDGLGSYVLGANSEFSIYYLTVPQVYLATKAIELVIDGMSMIQQALSDVYNELDQMFILDLDPNVLDFSNVQTDLDVINILEQSNPNFLTLTPYGIEKFHEIGDNLEEAFKQLNTFFGNLNKLMNAMEPYQEDFDFDIAEMGSVMGDSRDMTWDIYTDFAYPDSTVLIDGERVNLSAWFDNPPTSLLVMWKNYVTGVDSTLGGLFPDRYKEPPIIPPVSVEDSNLPKTFRFYPVYPNPFNPVATIAFDLPRTANVKLTIINLKGEIVHELAYGQLNAGKFTAHWDASSFPSGVYFVKLAVDGKVNTRKMTLMK
jgi:hypothetical protein